MKRDLPRRQGILLIADSCRIKPCHDSQNSVITYARGDRRARRPRRQKDDMKGVGGFLQESEQNTFNLPSPHVLHKAREAEMLQIIAGQEHTRHACVASHITRHIQNVTVHTSPTTITIDTLPYCCCYCCCCCLLRPSNHNADCRLVLVYCLLCGVKLGVFIMLIMIGLTNVVMLR